MLATFMEVLDTSVANVSLPHIAGTLSVSSDESTWVLTSYLVSNAVILPASGWRKTREGSVMAPDRGADGSGMFQWAHFSLLAAASVDYLHF